MLDRNLLSLYAFSKTLYEQNKNIYDAILPIILKSLENDGKPYTIKQLGEIIQTRYQKQVPQLVLIEVIQHATKLKYVKIIERKKYRIYKFLITEKGVEYLEKLEDERDIEREINYFIDQFRISSKNEYVKKADNNALITDFVDFINNNILDLLTLVLHNKPIDDSKQKRQIEVEIVKFISNIERSNPFLFNTFKDVFYGTIIYKFVVEGVTSSKTLALKPDCKIFLDTNVIFSILGWHHDYISRPCQELYYHLLSQGYNFFVFDFTLEEIKRVLHGFKSSEPIYPEDIKINSIYSVFKQKKLSWIDVKEIIRDINKILEEYGIKEWKTDVDLAKPHADINVIQRFKPNQNNEIALSHDLYAVQETKTLRNFKAPTSLDKVDYILLTSDTGVVKHNYINDKHNINGTIGECILDRSLSILKWFVNPESKFENIPIWSIIATHKDDMVIDRHLWERFHHCYTKLLHQDKIDEADVLYLVYSDGMEELVKCKEEDIDQEQLARLIDKGKKNLSALEQLTESQKSEIESKNQTLETITNERDSIIRSLVKEADKKARIVYYFIYALMYLIFLGIGYLIHNLSFYPFIYLIIPLIINLFEKHTKYIYTKLKTFYRKPYERF